MPVSVDPQPSVEQRLSDQEEVARMLAGLRDTEAEVVGGCSTWKAKATWKSAIKSACPKTALGRSSAGGAQQASPRGCRFAGKLTTIRRTGIPARQSGGSRRRLFGQTRMSDLLY